MSAEELFRINKRSSVSMEEVESDPQVLLGRYVTKPGLIVHNQHHFQCPICERETIKFGRGTGFAKAGASKHVGACFRKWLKSHGMKLADKYRFEAGGWLVEPLTK